METLSVTAKNFKHWAISSQAPVLQAIADGEGSTTIPEGSRVQGDPKRKAMFLNFTPLAFHDKLFPFNLIRRMVSCGPKIMTAVFHVGAMNALTRQRGCVAAVTANSTGTIPVMRNVSKRPSIGGICGIAPQRLRRLTVSRNTSAGIEKQFCNVMASPARSVGSNVEHNLLSTIKMVTAEGVQSRTMTWTTLLHCAERVMRGITVRPDDGRETMMPVLCAERQNADTMRRGCVPGVTGNMDDIVWSLVKAKEGAQKPGHPQHKRDELEKGLAGAKGSGELDSGVTARVVSTLLTWRQETTYPVMLVATANDVATLPSMVYRKGRLDEVWATDLPNLVEREAIFSIHLRKRNRDPLNFDTKLLAKRAEEMTGAEIEACIEDALFAAFDVGKEVSTKHIASAIKETIPQAQRDKEELKSIREWVEHRARLVSSVAGETQTASVRKLHPKKRAKKS